MAELKPKYFESQVELRKWFSAHSKERTELLVGFYKRGTGIPSVTWPESVDEALCVGWIDGVRNRIDDKRYQVRFTPRKKDSVWSAVNIDRVAALTAAGRMTEEGMQAFKSRSESRSRIYAYEQADEARLTVAGEREFRRNRTAWKFFSGQAPSYRQKMIYRISQAKRTETRARRLAALIGASEDGRRL